MGAVCGLFVTCNLLKLIVCIVNGACENEILIAGLDFVYGFEFDIYIYIIISLNYS